MIEEQIQYRQLINRDMAEDVARRAFMGSSTLIAVSKEVKAWLMRYVGDQRPIHVIPNGVRLERFANLAREEAPSARFTIGFLGTLKPWHGLVTLLTAFDDLYRRHPDFHLLIVGDGSERRRIEKDVKERGLGSAVSITGLVEQAEVPKWLGAMDVATAPYPALPGFYFSPLKVFEYMAAGLPIVASRIGQLTDIIDHGTSGLLIEPGDPAALTTAIEHLYQSAELRARLGRAARETVSANYTWDSVTKRILREAA